MLDRRPLVNLQQNQVESFSWCRLESVLRFCRVFVKNGLVLVKIDLVVINSVWSYGSKFGLNLVRFGRGQGGKCQVKEEQEVVN